MNTLTSAEFGELLAYDRLYGLPDERQQWLESMALAANLHAPRKSGGAWRAEEFDRVAQSRAAARASRDVQRDPTAALRALAASAGAGS